QVRVDQRVHRAALLRIRSVQLFDNLLISIRMVVGLGEDQRVRRRTERIVDAIELLRRRPFDERQRREVADDLVPPDAVEAERGARADAAGHPLVGSALVEALRGEADAEVALRRDAAEAPEPALLPGQRVMRLPWRSLPRLGTVAPAQLDEAPA